MVGPRRVGAGGTPGRAFGAGAGRGAGRDAVQDGMRCDGLRLREGASRTARRAGRRGTHRRRAGARWCQRQSSLKAGARRLGQNGSRPVGRTGVTSAASRWRGPGRGCRPGLLVTRTGCVVRGRRTTLRPPTRKADAVSGQPAVRTGLVSAGRDGCARRERRGSLGAGGGLTPGGPISLQSSPRPSGAVERPGSTTLQQPPAAAGAGAPAGSDGGAMRSGDEVFAVRAVFGAHHPRYRRHVDLLRVSSAACRP